MLTDGLEGWHIVIIVALIAVLFGAKRMPDAARSIGQSLRIFKSEMKAAAAEDGHEGARVAESTGSATQGASVSQVAQAAAPVGANGSIAAGPLAEGVESGSAAVAVPVAEPASRGGTSAG